MNIVIYTNGTARLTSPQGAVTDTATRRKYSEVVCRKQDIHRYTDGTPDTATEESSEISYSKYKIMLKAKSLGVWERLKAAIAAASLTESWETIVDIRSGNAELQAVLPAVREAFPDIDVDAFLADCVAE